jgi:hypothetical protein
MVTKRGRLAAVVNGGFRERVNDLKSRAALPDQPLAKRESAPEQTQGLD